jgi:branched-chain amino acid transport system ATP-binding protein
VLEVKNSTVNHGAITALHDVSLRVEAGAIVTLIGGNGAGKTTTLRAISGMLKPKSGQILYEGRDMTDVAAAQLVGQGHRPSRQRAADGLRQPHRAGKPPAWAPISSATRRSSPAKLEFVFATFPRLKERESHSSPAPSAAANSRCSPSAAPS